ncbi:MAG: immunity 53 family protein [Acidobacteriota bacterium]
MPSALEDLQVWFAKQCDGSWEHGSGIELKTLDNPGWLLRVDLSGFSLEGYASPSLVEGRSDSDWVRIEVVDSEFRGFGGPENLEELMSRFIDFVADLNPSH